MPKLIPDDDSSIAKGIGPAVRLALGADIVKTVGDKALTPPSVRLSVSNDGMPSKRDRYPEALTPPSVRLALSDGQAERNGTLEGLSVRLVAPNAGVDQQGSRTLQEDLSTCPALLVSFWYLEAFLSNRPRYHYRDWVMDSGAFSAHNSGAVINLQEYIDCCRKLITEDPTLTEIFALDVIGDWKGTKANTERMWKQGVPAIPCFHYGEPWDVLKGYCKDYPKVAIGGCVGRRDKDKFAGQCFARVWPKKLHGFGFGTEKSIMLYPWHSTDATNWEVGPCLAGDALVSTSDGLYPIAALVGRDIAVFTQDQLLVRGARAIQSGIKPTLKVILRSGQQIKCTADHKVMTKRGWIEAGELGNGDLVKIVNRQLRVPEVEESLVDEMLGWLTGDGWYTSGNTDRPAIGILFAPNDQEAMDRLMPVWDDFVGKEYALQEQNGIRRKSSESKEVLAKFEGLGFKVGRAPVKELPTYIFPARSHQQIAFLRGLFSADGSVGKLPSGRYGTVKLSSNSRALLRQVQIILLDYGIQSRMYWSRPDLQRNEQGELNINGYSALRYMKVIGFNLSVKTKKFDRGAKFFHQPVSYSEVISVEDGIVEPVYDILMPTVHQFIANGMVVHNCKYGTWKAFGRQRVSVRGSKQNLRAEVEWYLDLERRAQERWRKEMKLLDGLWPAVRLAINGMGQGEVNGALTRPNSVRLVVGAGRSVKEEELTKALGDPKNRKQP